MIKECTRCGESTEFKETHNKRQGYWCKPCRSRASIDSAKKHRTTKRKNNNAYASRRSNKRSEETFKWRSNHPEKVTAHRAVQTAIRNGSLVKQACEICGGTIRIHAHHDDYEKVLDVNWLCHTHHMERHAMLKERGEV
jgi:hypothetical protein